MVPANLAAPQHRVQADGVAFGGIAACGTTPLHALRACRRGLTFTLGLMNREVDVIGFFGALNRRAFWLGAVGFIVGGYGLLFLTSRPLAASLVEQLGNTKAAEVAALVTSEAGCFTLIFIGALLCIPVVRSFLSAARAVASEHGENK